MTLKNAAIVIAILAAGTLVIGYASAWFALDSCAEDVFLATQRRGVAGVDMEGNRVKPGRADITATIAGPFLVEVSYMLPRDLHGSIYYTRYIVFLGYRQQRSSDVSHLVTTQPRAPGLSASNSFKPTPLRGAA